jgi:hypothetical protein
MRLAALSLVWGLVMAGEPTAMPEAYWSVPAELRDKATVVVSGRYWTGTGPHEVMPNGGHRWPLLRGFEPTAVHRGDVKSDYVGVSEPKLFGPEDGGRKLVPGREYLILLQPSESSSKALRQQRGSRSWRDALAADEVLAIVPL